jgi:hypothetical protein
VAGRFLAARGEARAVLAALDARGIEVPDPVREDILGCTDLNQLDTWIRYAVTASKVQDLFDQRRCPIRLWAAWNGLGSTPNRHGGFA